MNRTVFKKAIWIFFIITCFICAVVNIARNNKVGIIISIMAVILNAVNLIIECKKDKEN